MVQSPQFWLPALQVAGDSFEQAKKDGATGMEASTYAILNALLNAYVEVGGGGIQELPDALKTGNRSAIRQWVDTMLDEGKEEIVQGIIERLLQNTVYGKGNALFSLEDPEAILNPLTAAAEFGGGAFVGGILGGGEMLFSGEAQASLKIKQEVKKAAKALNAIAKQLPENVRPKPLNLEKATPESVREYAMELKTAMQEALSPTEEVPDLKAAMQAALDGNPPVTATSLQKEAETAGILTPLDEQQSRNTRAGGAGFAQEPYWTARPWIEIPRKSRRKKGPQSAAPLRG
jgi:hypothetical protein